MNKKWSSLLHDLQKKSIRTSDGNSVSVLHDGDDIFDAYIDSIKDAKNRVWIQSYQFDNSPGCQAVSSELMAASRRGCDVVFAVDGLGSYNLKKSTIQNLENAGVTVRVFNPPLTGSGPTLFRNHQKIGIFDDTAFCGSMNLCESSGGPKYGTSRYLEIALKICGPAVADLGHILLDGIREGCDPVDRHVYVPRRQPDNIAVQVLESNVRKRRRDIQVALSNAVSEASSSVYLTTAFFNPPAYLIKALLIPTIRNIPVRILLSGSSDVWGDILATRHVLRRLVESMSRRMEIHQTSQQKVHAKCCVVDDYWSNVGSFNWDRLSWRRNLEASVAVYDGGVARRLREIQEERTRSQGILVSKEDFKTSGALNRFVSGVAHHATSLSGSNILDGLEGVGGWKAAALLGGCFLLFRKLGRNA